MRARPSWIGGFALLVACVAFSGLSVPLVTVEDGLDEISTERRRALAAVALQNADLLMDHPLQRLAYPASRVESIRIEPGHCAPGDPGSHTDTEDLVITVRYYTIFSIPGPRVLATCGGHAVRRE